MDAATLCLAIALYYEARGESNKAKLAVAEVIHNRTKSSKFPNDYCSVIKQKGQFSFYRGSIKVPTKEKESWNECVKIAQNFNKSKTNYTNGALYFNHQRLGVRFNLQKKAHIGKHVFF